MRATGPYSIGALAGKAARDNAGGMRGLTRRREGKAIALAALVFCLSGRAYADAGPETDNALATLCGIVEASAKAEGLPVDFFTKLIWRESSFRPNAVSPAGAQGVAQFMPGTANERGLIDPFDPASAIPASARFLNELSSASAIWAWRRRPITRARRRSPAGLPGRARFPSRRRTTCSPSPATTPRSGGAKSLPPTLRPRPARPA